MLLYGLRVAGLTLHIPTNIYLIYTRNVYAYFIIVDVLRNLTIIKKRWENYAYTIKKKYLQY